MPVEFAGGDNQLAGPVRTTAPASTPAPSVTVLGGVSTRIDGRVRQLTPSRRQLLAILVAAGPNGLSADHLAEELWSGDLPGKWDSSLRMAVSRLRRDLPPDALPAGDGRYRLELHPDEVDLWLLQLLAEDQTLEIAAVANLNLLRADQPFAGVELSPLLQLASDRARSCRLHLFDRILQSDEPVSEFITDELRAHAQADMLNESLVLMSARADTRIGQPKRALQTLETCRQALLRELQTDLDPSLAALADELASRGEPPEPDPAARPFPSALARQLAPPLVGREQLLEELMASAPSGGAATNSVLLLTGPSGIGKSRLAAAVAKQLHDSGVTIRYGAAEPHSEIAFGPLATLSASLFTAVGQVMTDGGDPQARAAAVWSRVLQFLEEANDQPFVAVIDDAHWLDTQTRDLLLFLTRAPVKTNIGLIMIGSDDIDHAPWHELRKSFQISDRVATFDISPYTRDDLLLLVNTRFEHHSLPAKRNLAAQLADLSGGNPAIAEAVLGSVDPVTLRPQNLEALDPEETVVELVRSLSTEARQIGGAAAVLGGTFDLDLLVALTDLDPSRVLAGLEELSQNRLVRELETPNLFRFDNLLVQRAVETTMLDARRRRTHAAAAQLVSSSHQRANHLASAVPTVPIVTAVEALHGSAVQHLSEGNSAEAVQAARLAEQLCPDPLPVGLLVVYASALDRAGASEHAARIRNQAFEAAEAENDWASALAAALSGLPAAERADGDADRLALLERIPLDPLDDAQRFRLCLALARQSFLIGNVQLAAHWNEFAAARSQTLSDATMASTTKWLLDRHSSDTHQRARWEPPGPIEEIPDDLRLSVLHALVIEAIEHGDLETAEGQLAEMGDLATRLRDSLGNWKWLLLRATLDYLAGDFDAGDAAANEANELGFAYGVTDAPTAFTAQLWFKSWLLDEHGSLAPLFDAGHDQLFRTDLARAARASSRFANEGIDRVREETIELVEQHRLRGSAFGACVPVILIDAVRALRDPAMNAVLIDGLAPWSGRMPVVGNGIADLGPIDYHLSKLVPVDGRADLLRSSLDLVDRAGVLPWQIAVRQALAEATSNADLKSAAHAMAEGTIFEALLR